MRLAAYSLGGEAAVFPTPLTQLKKVRDVAPRGVISTFVPKPAGLGYAEAMSQLRMWLDSRKVQPADFKITGDGRIGFEIGFSSERDAQEFKLFEWTQK